MKLLALYILLAKYLPPCTIVTRQTSTHRLRHSYAAHWHRKLSIACCLVVPVVALWRHWKPKHWLRVQALEEMTHVQKFFAYLNDRGGRVVLMPIGAPPSEWGSPLEVFQQVYAHEVEVTGLINKLMDLVLATSDHASSSFLQWFVSEQVEEEASADEVLQKLKLVDKSEGGLFLLDQEMDKRTFAPPADLAGVF